MKKIILAFLLVASTVVSRSQTAADDQQATTVLKTFYTAYLSAHDNNVLVGLRKKYCTPKCEKQIRQLIKSTDSDPIIKGQDSDPKWAKTLSVKRGPGKPNTYAVSYYYDEIGDDQKSHKTTVTIKLEMIKVNGVYKVDRIL